MQPGGIAPAIPSVAAQCNTRHMILVIPCGSKFVSSRSCRVCDVVHPGARPDIAGKKNESGRLFEWSNVMECAITE